MDIQSGYPTRRVIRWEATATAFTAYGIYLLIFDPKFIEIRQLATGRLLQVIKGDNVSCIGQIFLAMKAGVSKEERIFSLQLMSQDELKLPFSCCKQEPKPFQI